jgi:hypothetical protein
VTARRRWDVDERGVGVADARRWEPLIAGLAGAAGEDGWVAEAPELHLLPHLERATADGPVAIRRSSTDLDGTFVVELDWVGSAEPTRRELREVLFGLVGLIAETRTLVHEPADAGGRELEVLTGSIDADGRFAGHGHTIRLRVAIDAPGAPPPSPEA